MKVGKPNSSSNYYIYKLECSFTLITGAKTNNASKTALMRMPCGPRPPSKPDLLFTYYLLPSRTHPAPRQRARPTCLSTSSIFLCCWLVFAGLCVKPEVPQQGLQAAREKLPVRPSDDELWERSVFQAVLKTAR